MTGRPDVLATRDLRYRQADEREGTVTVTLFPPTQRTGMEWSCSFEIRTSAVLAAMLHDPDPDVWKAALDALVTVGGASARFVLERELARCSAQQRSWIEEAISQLRDEQH